MAMSVAKRDNSISSAVNAWKPTREQIAAAHGRSVPDILAPGVRVLFCGINPSLYSAAVGHHFARPGNRFWPTIHQAGFTNRLLSPFEDHLLLETSCGLTNIASRATATAEELSSEELTRGSQELQRKVVQFRSTQQNPSVETPCSGVPERGTSAGSRAGPASGLRLARAELTVAFLGITAYRIAFGRPRAKIGQQEETLEEATVWVLPNPSGLNAHYQLPDLVHLYKALREEVQLLEG